MRSVDRYRGAQVTYTTQDIPHRCLHNFRVAPEKNLAYDLDDEMFTLLLISRILLVLLKIAHLLLLLLIHTQVGLRHGTY